MIAPTEDDVGRGVYYAVEIGCGECDDRLPHGPPCSVCEDTGTVTRHEDGVITSLSSAPDIVFVRYKGQHPGAPGKATHVRDLQWATG